MGLKDKLQIVSGVFSIIFWVTFTALIIVSQIELNISVQVVDKSEASDE